MSTAVAVMGTATVSMSNVVARKLCGIPHGRVSIRLTPLPPRVREIGTSSAAVFLSDHRATHRSAVDLLCVQVWVGAPVRERSESRRIGRDRANPQGEGGGGKVRRERSTAQQMSRPWWMKKTNRTLDRFIGGAVRARWQVFGMARGPGKDNRLTAMDSLLPPRAHALATAATGDFDAQSVTAQLLLTASPRGVPHRWAAQRRTGSLSQASRLGVVMTLAPA